MEEIERLKFLSSRAINKKQIRKVLLVVILFFVGMLMAGNNKSYGATATTTYNVGEKSYEIDWEYETDADGNATNIRINSAKVDGSDTAKYLNVKIPAEINGAPVVSIGNGNTRIIEQTNTAEPFDFRILSVEIPDSVTEINDYAFESCIQLREVTWTNNIKRIGNYAFYRTACRKYKIINGDSYITRIIPENVEEIGDYAFCYNNDYFYALANLYRIWFSHGTLSYDIPSNTLVIGSKLKKIGNNAFENQSLTVLSIPSTVESIGNEAFKDNKKLYSVTIQDRASELEMGKGVFEGCTDLQSVTMENKRTAIPDKTFKNCEKLPTITVATNNITEIGNEAFSGCEALTTEQYNIIVDKVTKIGDEAFAKTGLTGQVEVKSIVTSLGKGAFSGSKVEHALLHENIEKIPARLFANCSNLTEITKANTVTEIEDSAFKNCDSITLEKLQSEFLPNIVTIGNSAFEACEGLDGTLIIPSNVAKIGDYAFYNCHNLVDINFNEGIKNIGGNAFYNINIPEIKSLPSTVETVGSNAFYQVREAFFDGDLPALSPRWYGIKDVLTHYNNHTHRIDVTCSLPGVKLVNVDNNNSDFTSGDYACKGTYNLKVVIDEEYKNAYQDLVVKVVSVGKYESSPLIKKYIELDEENKFTVGNYIEGRESEGLIRDLQIVVQKSRNETDLVLRKYITKINGEDITESRKPIEETSRTISNVDPILYKHTKYPVSVEKNDKVTYSIRVYNEGDVAGKVNEIKVYLQDGLELANSSTINTNNGWQVADTPEGETGVILVTDALKEEEIPAYRGEGKPQYKEIELECRVVKDDSKRLVSIAELSDSTDADSSPGKISLASVAGYKEDESYGSTYQSFIESEQDSIDFESVEIKKFVKIGYTIAIQKIDVFTNELLDGAEFTLYDENQNVLEENVPVRNGILEFSEIISYGEGVDTYYIEEVKTPAGYKKTIEGKMELTVQKIIAADGTISLKITCEVNEEADVNEAQEFIPINTVEQLVKIGSNEEVTINGNTYTFTKDANYRLNNDITLSGEWTPIEEFYGIFDGNGHKILNLSKTGNIEYEGDTYKFGLFGTVSGVIRNLALENINIDVMVDTTNIDTEISALKQQITNLYNKYREREITWDEYSASSNEINAQKENLVQKKEQLWNNCYIGGIAGYMTAGTIENCSISGKIETNAVNVGGFISHTAPENFVKIKDSINEAVVIGGKNVGGLIGCAKGNIELINCINKGTVKSKDFFGNAGGLVGVSDPKGTTAENIVVGYDKLNKRITIAVKNKKTTGSYDLVLEKVNTKTNAHLDGAVFNIYDENLNIIPEYEEVEAEDGILKISNILIDSLKSDVFYIKEVEAPEGYDIAIKDYVKVEVTKTWNSETGKYEVDIIPSVTTGIEGTQGNVDGQDTGITSDFVGSEYVIYKTDRMRASNCSNEGTVVSENDYGTSGGIVGLTVGNVDIYDSKNIGKVSSMLHVGGIVGFLGGHDDGKESKIIRCENGISGSETPSIEVTKEGAFGAIGGIVGTAVSNTTFNECKNYSKINGLGEHTGGILGASFDRNLYVYNCDNYGDISLAGGNSNADIGGIIGVQYGRGGDSLPNVNGTKITNDKNVETTIINCKSVGNIDVSNNSSCSQTGGIIGEVFDRKEGDSLYIANCSVGGNSKDEMMNIFGTGKRDCRCTGGLLGRGTYDEIIINNNKLINLEIHRDALSTGSIGVLAGEITTKSSDKENLSKIEASNNIVDTVIVKTEQYINNANLGVLFGMLDVGENVERDSNIIQTNIEIRDNIVRDTKALSTNANQSSIGSLAGYIYGMASVNVKNNSIIDTDIIWNGGESGSSGVGGLIGELWVIETNIDNCEIKSTNTSNKHKIEQTYNPTDGATTIPVGGYIGAVEIGKVTISNSKLTNMDVISTGETGIVRASAIGGLIGESKCKVTVDRVEIDNLHMDAEGLGTNSPKGGFVGISSDIEVTNSKLTNSILDLKTGSSVAGIVGHVHFGADNSTFKNLDISNIDINVEPNDISGWADQNFCIGGVVGWNGSNKYEMDSCTVSNLDITTKDSLATNVGIAVGGFLNKNCNISNIKVENSKINANMIDKSENNRTTNFTMGGIVGVVKGSEINTIGMNNITIDGLEIYSNISHVGGLVGYVDVPMIIDNAVVKNTKLEENELEEKNLSTKRDLAYGGLVGNAISNNINGYDMLKIRNSSVENLEIKQKAKSSAVKHAGGLVGLAKKVEISNTNNTNTVTNLKITNDAARGTVGGLVAVIVEEYYNRLGKEANITDAKVENFTANGNYAIGGIIGIGVANIRDSIVSNMNTLVQDGENPLPTGETVVGGIAGIAVEESELSNVTVNSKETEGDENSGTTLTSNYIAGGIAGINSGRIIDAIVDKITVKSNKEFVEVKDIDEIEDLTEEEINNAEAEVLERNQTMEKTVSAISAQYFEEAINSIIKQVTVIQGTVSEVVDNQP